MNSLQVANTYTELGCRVIPVPLKSKVPELNGWQKLRLEPSDLPKRFAGAPQNVGILMGEPSNGIVDVDLDCPEAIALAPRLLIQTGARFGHAAKRNSHWLFRCDPIPA